MSFVIAKAAVAVVISPVGASLLLGAGALALAACKQRRLAAGLGGVALAWLLLWSTPVVSHLLRSALEAPYPPLPMADVPAAQAIVVLGGGIAPPGPGRPMPDLNQAADRVWHAARLYRADKAPVVVLSGGSGAAGETTSEAQAMQQLLLEWQLPAGALLLEEHSRNTAENARLTQELLQPRGIRRVLLVTSALHMARARAHFEAVGLEVTPAATDHEGRSTAHWPWWQRWLPSTDALDGSARGLKEWVGRLAMTGPRATFAAQVAFVGDDRAGGEPESEREE